MMPNYEAASKVLERARDEIINEIIRAGDAGGVGRAQNYAPILCSLQKALEISEQLRGTSSPEPKERGISPPEPKAPKTLSPAVVDRIAKMRAARMEKLAAKKAAENAEGN